MLHHDDYEKPWDRDEKPKKELPSKKRKKEREPEVQLWLNYLDDKQKKIRRKDIVMKLTAAKRIVFLYPEYEYTEIEESRY